MLYFKKNLFLEYDIKCVIIINCNTAQPPRHKDTKAQKSDIMYKQKKFIL